MLLKEIVGQYKNDVLEKKYDEVVIGLQHLPDSGKIYIKQDGEVIVTGNIEQEDLNRPFSLLNEKILKTKKSILSDDNGLLNTVEIKIMNVIISDIVKNWSFLELLTYACNAFEENEVQIALDRKKVIIVKNGNIHSIFESSEVPLNVNGILVRVVNDVAYINVLE